MRKSGGGGVGKKKQTDAIDEVEELLKLTEDDLLLKLTVNSHISSKSKSKSKSKFDFLPESSSHTNAAAIDPDLDRRLEALRSKPKPKPKPNPKEEAEDVDNLFARFAALKKGPSNATAVTCSNSTTTSGEHGNAVKKDDTLDMDEDEDDEVSKIISWAIDAARLDPSPSSEDDDDDNESDDESEDEEASSKVDRKNKPSKK